MSEPQWALLIAVVVVLAAGWYAIQLAKRLDRLHWRVLTTRDTLDRLSARRAADASLLASSGLLDAADAARLGRLAAQCLASEGARLVNDELDRRRDGLHDVPYDERQVAERSERESALSRELAAVLTPQMRERIARDPGGRSTLESLDAASYRVQLTRSMHNVDVTQVRHLRENPWVRLFHLYGHAPAPTTIDFDDGARTDGVGM